MAGTRAIPIDYYRKESTKMIHMVAANPAPKKEGHSNCGQDLDGMTLMERKDVRRAHNFEFCLKCTQLLGLH